MSDLSVLWHRVSDGSDQRVPFQRPVLVALHGFFGSPADWEPVLMPFAKTHDLCLVTLPGHRYQSTHARLFTFNGITAELMRVVSAYDPRKRILLGYSLGGRIVSYAALTEQLHVSGVILLSSHPGLELTEQRWARILSDDIAAERLRTQSLDNILQEWYTLPLFAHERTDVECVSSFVERRRNHHPSDLARCLTGFSLGWQSNLRGLLRFYSGKLLYLAGEKDEAYRKLAQEVFTLHPGRRARILPDVGHDLLGAASCKPSVMSRLQSEIADFLALIGKEK